MSTNQEQLRHLERLASTESAKAMYLHVLVTLLAGAIVSVAYVAVFEPSRIPIRPELYDLSSVIFVFLVFALIQAASALVSAHARRREIDYLCAMQNEALHFAEQVLGNEANKEPWSK
jgi:hypothetical protein